MVISRSFRTALVTEILEAHDYDPEQPGPALGAAAVTGHVPTKLVADVLGVNVQAVYRWYRGAQPATHKERKMRILTDIIQHGIRIRLLPVGSTQYAAVQRALDRAAESLKEQKRLEDAAA